MGLEWGQERHGVESKHFPLEPCPWFAGQSSWNVRFLWDTVTEWYKTDCSRVLTFWLVDIICCWCSKKGKMTKGTYLISQDNSTLTFLTLCISSNHCNILLQYEEHIYFLYLNVVYFCRSSHGSVWIQWSSHRPLKIVKSISSKVENCAWFGDCL